MKYKYIYNHISHAVLAVIAAGMFLPSIAYPADAAPAAAVPLSQQLQQQEQNVAPQAAAQSAQTSPWLFGDWGGERTRLRDKGIDFTLNYTADLQRNFHGGASVDNDFWGRLRAAVELDLGKLASIPGARIYISGLTQSGGNINALTGAYTSASSIVGADTTRLDQFFYEQTLANGNLMIRAGQLAAIDEFGMSAYGDYFLNLELGYASNFEFAANTPFNAGGQLGGLLRLGQADRGLYVKAGAFSGTPDTFNADAHGIDFRWNDTVVAAEAGYSWIANDRPARVRVGAHYDTDGHFQRWDGTGDAGANQMIYAGYNQTLWQEHGGAGRGVDLSAMFFTAPANRNKAEYQGMLSAVLRAPFASRPSDAFAIGCIYTRMSDDYAKSIGIPRGDEQVFEASYTFKATKWFLVQPDIQYVRNPSGNETIDDAWVAGVRLQAVF